MRLPAPVLDEVDGIIVVRDDLLPGGTKRRVVHVLFDGEADEYVYPSPAQGYAQLALAYACKDAGFKATIFVAKRAVLHPRTNEAQALGAAIHQVRGGYLTVVQARARDYCMQTGARLLPEGLDCVPVVEALASVARGLPVQPNEVWAVAATGTLTRSLQLAWPEARHFAVRTGMMPKPGASHLFTAPERYEQNAGKPPPFPSCVNYDAKVWRFIRMHATPGALFWNVAA